MKKKIIFFFVFVLALTILQAGIPAYAAGTINNQIKGEHSAAGSSSSGRDFFYAGSNYYKIEQPRCDDYCYQPYTMYVNAPKGHSVYVYDYWEATDEHQIGTTFHGSRVIVFAEHGDYSCILFHEQDYQQKVAWVRSTHLCSYYPGKEITVGWVLDPDPIYVGDPQLSWSRDSFIRTGRKYTLLSEPIKDCVYFTLDYQVTSRNGAETSEVLGPRDVYINDGSGWVWVCRFEYPRTEACHVNISLSDFTTIKAFAVIADCAKPDTFVCRQSLLDVLQMGDFFKH